MKFCNSENRNPRKIHFFEILKRQKKRNGKRLVHYGFNNKRSMVRLREKSLEENIRLTRNGRKARFSGIYILFAIFYLNLF
jgi:hypothetical protein